MPERDGRFLPTAAATRSACADCHGDDVEFSRPGRVDEFLASVDEAPSEERTVKYAYDAFSHADHVRAAGIGCAVCHVPDDHAQEGLEVADVRALRDFKAVDFEACMGCHADEAEAPELVRHLAWADRAPDYSVRWHGATDEESKCEVCHAERYAKPLRTTERRRFEYLDQAGTPIARAAAGPKLLFAYAIRSHEHEFEAGRDLVVRGASAHADDDCQRCHVDGDWLSTGERREGPFFHGLHLERLRFDDEVADLRTSAQGRATLRQDSLACDECHAGIVGSRELSQPFYEAETDACADCHRSGGDGGDDGSSVPRAITDPGRIRLLDHVEQVEFPHDLHTSSDHESLRSGCYSCHTFQASAIAHRSPLHTPRERRGLYAVPRPRPREHRRWVLSGVSRDGRSGVPGRARGRRLGLDQAVARAEPVPPLQQRSPGQRAPEL